MIAVAQLAVFFQYLHECPLGALAVSHLTKTLWFIFVCTQCSGIEYGNTRTRMEPIMKIKINKIIHL